MVGPRRGKTRVTGRIEHQDKSERPAGLSKKVVKKTGLLLGATIHKNGDPELQKYFVHQRSAYCVRYHAYEWVSKVLRCAL